MQENLGFTCIMIWMLEMGKKVELFLFFTTTSTVTTTFFLGLLLCSVTEAVRPDTHNEVKIRTSTTSSVQKDVTTPLTTVPTINYNPSSAAPILNPNSIPETPPVSWVPFETPTTSASPVSSGSSWCVASSTAPRSALQMGLDYACGHGGADCSAIQPGGSCFYPDSLRDHASYAFNRYYQKNPIPNSCIFGGNAVTTSTNPSYETCQFPFTSTSSSILDTANQNMSTVFGVGPPGPSVSEATCVMTHVSYISTSMYFTVLLLLLLRNDR